MKKIASRVLFVVLAASMLLAIYVTAHVVTTPPAPYYTDGGTIRQELAGAPLRQVLWNPPVRLDAPIGSPRDEHEAHVSPDGQTLFFVRGRPGHDADLYVATRITGGWSEPRSLASINTVADELGPALAPDGRTLYFHSNRAEGRGGYDIWAARRIGRDEWETPVNLGPEVNGADDEYGACIAPDGRAIYFASNRRGDDDEAADPRDYDIYAAPLGAGVVGAAVVGPYVVGPAAALDDLNSPHDEGAPALSPVADFLYFASNRPGGQGGFDLYRSRRMADGFAPPENLDAPVNTPANEIDPAVAEQGFVLLFSSDRLEGERVEADADATAYNLYASASREVFRAMENRGVPWAAILSLIAPLLPWVVVAIIAALLLPLFFKLLRGDYERLRPLSILARCLLISLVAHALVVLLSMVWAVASSIPDAMGRSTGGTRVALTSPSIGKGITAQVRGALAEADRLEPTTEALLRQTLDAKASVPPEPARLAPGTLVAVTETARPAKEADDAAPQADVPPVHQVEILAAVPPAPVATMTAAAPITDIEPAAPRAVMLEAAPTPAATARIDHGPIPGADMRRIEPVTAAPPADIIVWPADDRSRREAPGMDPDPPARDVAIEARVAVRFDGPASAPPIDATEPIARRNPLPVEPAFVAPAMAAAPKRAVDASVSVAPRDRLPGAPRAVMIVRGTTEAPAPVIAAATTRSESPPRSAPTSILPTMPAPPVAFAPLGPSESEPVAPTRTTAAVAHVPAPSSWSIATIAAAAQITPAWRAPHAASTVALVDAARTAGEPLPAPIAPVASVAPALPKTRPTLVTRAIAAAPAARFAEAEVDAAAGLSPVTAIPTRGGASSIAARTATTARLTPTPSTVVSATLAPPSSATPAASVAVFAPDVSEIGLPPSPVHVGAMKIAAPPVNDRRIERRVEVADAAPPFALSATRARGRGAPPRDTRATVARVDPVAVDPRAPRPRTVDGSLSDARVAVVGDLAVPVTLPSRLPPPAAPAVRIADAVASGPTSRPAARVLPTVATADRAPGPPLSQTRRGLAPAADLAPSPVRLAHAPSVARGAPAFESAEARSRLDPPPSARPTPTSLPPVLVAPLAVHAPEFEPAEPPRRTAPARTTSARVAARLNPGSSRAPLVDLPVTAKLRSEASRTVTRSRMSPSPRVDPAALPTGPPRPAPDLVVTLPDRRHADGAEEREARPAARRTATVRASRRADTARTPAPVAHLAQLPARTIDRDRLPPPRVKLPAAASAAAADAPRLPDVTSPTGLGRLRPIVEFRVPDRVRSTPYPQRAPARRPQLLAERGGSKKTERAVADALDWLMRHQAEDGRWDGGDYDEGCGRCAGAARREVSVAVTALALLSYFAADHTHVTDGPYRDTVARAIDWLLTQQAERGDFISGETMYSHGAATIALAEAYGMTADPALLDPLERAVDFTIQARNRFTGGWRYVPGQDGDTSVLGWQVMALISARRAGLDVPSGPIRGAKKWLGRVTDPTAPGRYAYRPTRPPSPSMTAEGMYVQQLLGMTPDDPVMERSAQLLLENLPKWSQSQSSYYWFYGTLALFQHGGSAWTRWNEHMKQTLLANQAKSGPAAGSWAPDDVWAQVGGRVYQTALCALTLEIYYRYLPIYVDDGGGGGTN